VAVTDQVLNQVRIAAMLGDPCHVIKKLIFRIRPEIGASLFLLAQVRNKKEQIIKTVVGDTDRTRGKGGVPPTLVNRGAFKHGDAGALFAGGECGAERRVAGANNDHVMLAH
jgi:hypothetical protein